MNLFSRIYEGMLISLDVETYHGDPFNADGASLRHSRHGVSTYELNGVNVTREEAEDALERAQPETV